MKSNRMQARIFGISCLFSFVSYASGTALMDALQNTHPQQVMLHKQLIITGYIFITVLHTLSNLAMLTIMQHTLKPFNAAFSCLYFSLGSFATFILATGAVFTILSVPLSESFFSADQHSFESLILLCTKGNFYCYQSGMCVWGIGGLFLCSLLRRSKLVPSFFPFTGYAGYLLFIAGTTLELYGCVFGIILSVPGGFFELSLGTWLIVKGFSKTKVPVLPSAS